AHVLSSFGLAADQASDRLPRHPRGRPGLFTRGQRDTLATGNERVTTEAPPAVCHTGAKPDGPSPRTVSLSSHRLTKDRHSCACSSPVPLASSAPTTCGPSSPAAIRALKTLR